MLKRLAILSLVFSGVCHAYLGGTREACERKYGPPVNKSASQMEYTCGKDQAVICHFTTEGVCDRATYVFSYKTGWYSRIKNLMAANAFPTIGLVEKKYGREMWRPCSGQLAENVIYTSTDGAYSIKWWTDYASTYRMREVNRLYSYDGEWKYKGPTGKSIFMTVSRIVTHKNVGAGRLGGGAKGSKPVAGKSWTIPSLGMELMPVYPGNFLMGTSNTYSSHSLHSSTSSGSVNPGHKVRISHGFWVGKYEVTQVEYEKLMMNNPSSFKGSRNPVEAVSWNDAVTFCKKLTELERATGRLPKGYAYRLPTEAEWEYAARGGQRSKGFTYSGGNDINDLAWYQENAGDKTHPVGQKQANELGLYDMVGNVSEWCQDAYDRDYYSKSPGTDPGGVETSPYRVYRGGSVRSYSGDSLKPAYRFHATPTTQSRYTMLGFRLILAPSLEKMNVGISLQGGDTGALAVDKADAGTGTPPVAGKSWTIPGISMALAPVYPGRFKMGSTDGSKDEIPVHRVGISHGFWMGKYEVTQAEYQALTGKVTSRFIDARSPVVSVSWNDATAFCQKLTERERGAGHLPKGYEYRLPTEAEWEYVARGGEKSKGYTYSGSNTVDDVAWHSSNGLKEPQPVGQKQANELGIYDMAGNVWEWCRDRYAEDYYSKSPAIDPTGAETSSYRVFRGGGWSFNAANCRSANRMYDSPESAYSYLGFRVVLAPVLTR